MIPTLVLDNKGDECIVWLLAPNYSTKPFNDGTIGIRSGIQLPCGDTYMTWMPVFTEWWT